METTIAVIFGVAVLFIIWCAVDRICESRERCTMINAYINYIDKTNGKVNLKDMMKTIQEQFKNGVKTKETE